MKLGQQLPYILAAVSLVQATSVVIKGVDPSKYDLYQPNKNGQWTCFDGSKTIPHSAINDDYCDCPDGSDEPGTSACPNALFYCANKGHIPAYIKSYAVNDGVCDEACCDGSDEDGTLTTCPDRCQEIGEAYRAAQASLEASTQAGLAAKQQLIEEAQEQRLRWQDKKTKVEDQIILKKSTLLKLQRDLQKLEQNTHNGKHRKCPSSLVEVETLKHDITILKKELASLNVILSDMKRDHNQNYHDLAVKGAITKYDAFAARYPSIVADIEEHLAEMGSEGEGENDIDDDNHDDDEEQDDDENFEKAAEAVEQDKTGLDNQEGKKHHFPLVRYALEFLDPVLPAALKNKVTKWLLFESVAVPHERSVVSKEAVIDNARDLVNKAREDLEQLNRELDTLNENLETDYGVDGEWLKLKDVCIEKDEGEYTYSLCFLGEAYQKSNKDSSRTFLGKFEKFDGGDTAADKYKVHVHERGTRCWNGPLRSVRATIECGRENEILEVTEPQKCEYHYKLRSPAVCQSLMSAVVHAATAAGVHEDVASKVAEEVKEKEIHVDLSGSSTNKNTKPPAHEEL